MEALHSDFIAVERFLLRHELKQFKLVKIKIISILTIVK